jgi:peroxiredoxin
VPYPVLSDEQRVLAAELALPTFTAAGMTLYRRLTMIVTDGVIEHVFYPVFPPNQHAGEVVAWLKAHSAN